MHVHEDYRRLVFDETDAAIKVPCRVGSLIKFEDQKPELQKSKQLSSRDRDDVLD